MPDTVYEARPVPLLLHEDFMSFDPDTSSVSRLSASLGSWCVFDDGIQGGQSGWEIKREATEPESYSCGTYPTH